MSDETSAPVAATETPTAPPTEQTQTTQEKVQAQPQADEQKYTIKVNGREKQVTLAELTKYAQMGDSATERYKEAMSIRKNAESIINKAKSNPIEALFEAGLSKDQVKDYMEKWYAKEYIEPETLSKEERRIKELEERLEQAGKRDKELEEQRLAEQTQKMTQHWQQKIIETIDTYKLPKTEWVAQKILQYAKENLDKDYNAPMEVIAELVRDDIERQNIDMVRGRSVQELIHLLGDETVQSIYKHYLTELRAKRGLQEAPKEPQPVQPKERLTSRDVDQRLKQMRMGKW